MILYSRDVILYSRDVILYSRDVILYSRDVILYSRDVMLDKVQIMPGSNSSDSLSSLSQLVVQHVHCLVNEHEGVHYGLTMCRRLG